MPHTNPTMISGRGALMAVVLMLLAPLGAVVATAGPALAGPAFEQPAIGECRALTMTELQGKSNSEAPIDCAEAHTARVIATGRLPKGVTWGASTQQLQRIATSICDPAWKTALGGSYSSRIMTAYSWGWFIPAKAQRDRGARWIRCDLILLGGTGLVRLPTDNVPALAAQPHPDTIAACMKRTFVTTNCARSHAWRASGTFVISQKQFPTDRQFQRAVARRCPSRVTTKTFAYRHRDVTRWRLGDHQVACYSHTSN